MRRHCSMILLNEEEETENDFLSQRNFLWCSFACLCKTNDFLLQDKLFYTHTKGLSTNGETNKKDFVFMANGFYCELQKKIVK